MKQLALYGLNGVMNTLVGYLVFFALTQVIDYRIAIVIGYSVAMALSYALNSRIVFRGRGRPARFVVLNLGLMALNVAMTWSIVTRIGLAAELAQLIAIPIVFLVGFVLNKALVFNLDSLSR